jgi:P-type Cu+ transporter
MSQSLNADGERMRADGATIINIAVDGKLAGLFAIATLSDNRHQPR